MRWIDRIASLPSNFNWASTADKPWPWWMGRYAASQPYFDQDDKKSGEVLTVRQLKMCLAILLGDFDPGDGVSHDWNSRMQYLMGSSGATRANESRKLPRRLVA